MDPVAYLGEPDEFTRQVLELVALHAADFQQVRMQNAFAGAWGGE